METDKPATLASAEALDSGDPANGWNSEMKFSLERTI
jgi:hypothetical protein